jgi:hypothetical protein
MFYVELKIKHVKLRIRNVSKPSRLDGTRFPYGDLRLSFMYLHVESLLSMCYYVINLR